MIQLLLQALLTIEKFLKQQKTGQGLQPIHVGGSIFTLPLILSAIIKLRKLLGGKEPTKEGKGVTLTQYISAIKTLKDAKIGSGIAVHHGGFIFTIPLLLSALAAVGSIAGGAAAITNAVHNKSKNDAELAEQKRHNAAMEPKAAGSGLGKKKSQTSLVKRGYIPVKRNPSTKLWE